MNALFARTPNVYLRVQLRAVLLAAAMLAGALPAHAQVTATDLADATLDDLMRLSVTTASRTSESLLDAPARMQVITDHQIRRRGYRSLGDVLKDLPDFKVDFGGDPDYPVQLTVQGTTGARNVIVLLDGVRVSSPTNEPLPILYNYPVHSAEQIEIVYGPASALYGADAFSAVINIISKDATDQSGITVESALGQFGLYNQSGSYVRRVGVAGSLLLAGQAVSDRQPDLSQYYPSDFRGLQGQKSGVFNTIFGPMTPPSPVPPSYQAPITAHSLQATLRAGNFQLSLFQGHERSSTTVPYDPDNGIYTDDAFMRNTLVVASGTYTRRFGRVTSATTLTGSRHEMDPQSGYQNVFSQMTRSYKYAYGSMLKGEQQLSWKPFSTLAVTTGGTVERFSAIPQTADLNSPIETQRVPGTLLFTDIADPFYALHYTNTGGYVQGRYAVSSRVAVTLGARGDYNTRYGGTFNPRFGLVAQITPATTAKVLVGTAYLAPSPYQSYGHYGSFYSLDGGATYQSDYWHVPTPDLKPEKKATVEGTIQHAFGPSVSLSASAFRSHSTNLIQLSDPDQAGPGSYRGWPVAYIDFPVNEGDASTYGGTLGLEVQKGFSYGRTIDVRAALSMVEGHLWHQHDDGSDQVEIGGMSPWQLHLGADLRLDEWTVAPRMAVSSRQRTFAIDEDSHTRLTIPGYASVQVELRRANVFTKGLELFASVENAFDARYRNVNTRAYSNPEELVGAPQNPRRLTAGFRLQLQR
jgi:outer membrane cobalamin receptor